MFPVQGSCVVDYITPPASLCTQQPRPSVGSRSHLDSKGWLGWEPAIPKRPRADHEQKLKLDQSDGSLWREGGPVMNPALLMKDWPIRETALCCLKKTRPNVDPTTVKITICLKLSGCSPRCVGKKGGYLSTWRTISTNMMQIWDKMG